MSYSVPRTLAVLAALLGAQAAAQNTIKVGLIMPASGVYAQLGQEGTKGFDLYLESIGYRVAGKTIQVIKEDEEADAAVAVRKGNKLISSDKVDILAGVVLTPSAYALAPIVEQAKTPLIVFNAAGNALTRDKKNPYVFRVSGNAWQYNTSFGKYVAQKVPLAGLSAHERDHVMNLILNLPRELTIVLIEHDLPFCLEFTDHVTVLSNGELLATGTPDEIRNNPQVQAVYVGSALERHGREVTAEQMAAPPILTVKNIGAAYGSAVALEDVSIEVRPGEVVAVLGRNGMGKTTLLTTMMGWRSPTHGQVVLNGQNLTKLRPSDHSHAGMALVPQGRRVLAELTVDEELRLASRPGKWTLERVYQTFPRLKERQRSFSTTLSGGEQQMVAIGRALLQNPTVLLLDEPTEGLSPLMVTVVRDVLLQLRESGETILLAEQNLDLALAVADRVYVLDHGTVSFDGDAEHLAQNRELVQELMGV